MQTSRELLQSAKRAACHSAQFVTNHRGLRHKSITTASSAAVPRLRGVKIFPSL
jgi:hypothetical protein